MSSMISDVNSTTDSPTYYYPNSDDSFEPLPHAFNDFSDNLNNTVIIDTEISFIFHGIGILLLALFGIPANVVSVIVLSHSRMKFSLSVLLVGLSVSDIFVVGTSLVIFSFPAIFYYIPVFGWYKTVFTPHANPWLYPIALTAQMCSIYFTVVVTLERYIAVCLPLRARSLCTRSSARRSAFFVTIISILYNIPRWFEFTTVPKYNNTTKRVEFTETETDLRNNELYISYYVNWSYLVVFYLIPFVILLVFNIHIYREIKRQRTRRSSLGATRVNNRSPNEDIALAGMLFGIVITFFACQILALVINLMENFGIGDIGKLIPANNFLIVLSSSVNFVFYCVFGTQFRRRLKQTLHCEDDTRKPSVATIRMASSSSVHRSSTKSHVHSPSTLFVNSDAIWEDQARQSDIKGLMSISTAPFGEPNCIVTTKKTTSKGLSDNLNGTRETSESSQTICTIESEYI